MILETNLEEKLAVFLQIMESGPIFNEKINKLIKILHFVCRCKMKKVKIIYFETNCYIS